MRAQLLILKMLARAAPADQRVLVGAMFGLIETMIAELARLKARLDIADSRRAKFAQVANKYIAAAVDGGAIPAEVAREFIDRMEAIDHG